ncbi:MAG: hypothetical protein ACYC9K_08085 [Sulfuricaulis sp.]
MKLKATIGIVTILVTATLGIFGCAGTAPLNTAYRAGDTVALGAGWKQHFDRNSLTVTFTGSDGSTTVYSPGDSRLRAVINLSLTPCPTWSSGRARDRTSVTAAHTVR